MFTVSIVVVVVDDSLFFASRTAISILFVDTDFFLVVASTIFAAWKRCGNGRVTILPSDALSLPCFSFYLDTRRFFFSLVPIRGREKTERNRDSEGSSVRMMKDGSMTWVDEDLPGVVVQIDDLGMSSSSAFGAVVQSQSRRQPTSRG